MATAPEGTVSPEMVYDGFISYSHASDDLLAPRVQAGLQRFAKPWWKRRALRIFRDESSLSANPHLWSSITEALDGSAWMVVLLSPESVESTWVNDEIAYWTEHKDTSRVIPVVTDGTFGWEDGELTGTAVPEALRRIFGEEPRWVDLRFARTDEQLDLQNPRFSAAIADVASAIRGIPKDELESEEVRQHRRTRRTAWSAGIIVLLLGVAAAIGAIVAVDQSNEARRQRDQANLLATAEAVARADAEEQRLEAERLAAAEAEARAEAETNEELAAEQAAVAQQQTTIAIENELVARAEALASAATSQLDLDPELSVLLALQAMELNASPAAVNAMHAALQQHRTIFQAEVADRSSNLTAIGGLSPDGALLALAMTYTDALEVWNVDSGEVVWTVSTAGNPLRILNAGFTVDGSRLVVLLIGDLVENPEPAMLWVFDAATGELEREITAPDCTGTKYFPGVETPFYDLSRPMVWVRDLDCEFFVTPESELGLFDPDTGSFTPVLPIKAFGLTVIGTPTQDAAGRLIAVDDAEGFDGRVVDVSTGEIVYEYGGGMATLSADGSRLLARSDGENPPIRAVGHRIRFACCGGPAWRVTTPRFSRGHGSATTRRWCTARVGTVPSTCWTPRPDSSCSGCAGLPGSREKWSCLPTSGGWRPSREGPPASGTSVASCCPKASPTSRSPSQDPSRPEGSMWPVVGSSFGLVAPGLTGPQDGRRVSPMFPPARR